ncbi:MAG: hypothetical protein SPF89_11225 [Sphaerochaetaceae bacterium]|nr:hypothetical protein [Spirochaetales bacterium]MDY5500667.1 hypothetical protein [Sphaerochaetaceae bacterium]
MFKDLLNQTCSILRPSRSDGWGGGTSYEAIASGVPCRMQPASGREWLDGAVRGEATHRLFLKEGVDVRSSDIIEICGIRYEVLLPVADAGGQGHHIELALKERV